MSTITVNNGGGKLDLELGCGILPPAAVMIKHGGDRMFFAGNVAGDLSSSSCSSIGKNSDDDDDDDEVESKNECGGKDDRKSGSFDAIQALEEALPLRRGISRYYNGKSKSFTSLADATPLPSVKEIVKPENAYTRKRRNLLASTLLWEDNKKIDESDERSSKKSCTNVSRTTSFAFTVAMNNTSNNNIDKDSNSNNKIKKSQVNVSSSSRVRNLSALRSYSMADLQRCQ